MMDLEQFTRYVLRICFGVYSGLFHSEQCGGRLHYYYGMFGGPYFAQWEAQFCRWQSGAKDATFKSQALSAALTFCLHYRASCVFVLCACVAGGIGCRSRMDAGCSYLHCLHSHIVGIKSHAFGSVFNFYWWLLFKLSIIYKRWWQIPILNNNEKDESMKKIDARRTIHILVY